MVKPKILVILNLRLFDTQTTLLNTPGNDLSPEMKTYYDKRLIDNAEPNLVYNQFGDKKPIPKGGGKIIEFRKYTPLDKATTPLTEGVTPEGNKLDVTKINAEVDQYGDFIEISDVLDLTAIDPNLEIAMQLLGSQAGRTLDTVTREIVTAGTNVTYPPKADGSEVLMRGDIDGSCLLTPKVINQVVAKLRRYNTLPFSDGYYVAVIHPDTACDIMNSDGWTEAHKYTTPENIYRGEIGRLGGVRFVESTEAKIVGGAGADGCAVYCSMFFGQHSYGVTSVEGGGLKHIVKPLGSAGTSDPLNQRATAGWKAMAVAEMLVQQYACRVEHGSESNPMAESN